MHTQLDACVLNKKTRNSSGDEIANVNFLYDDIVHALKYKTLAYIQIVFCNAGLPNLVK